jgi:CO dehydrogenase nickel-insertion accessory protein CooC1
LLGELERDSRIVVFDMEAGLGTLLRLQPGTADVVLVVAEPSAKAIEIARRAAETAESRGRVIVVANKVREEADIDVIREALGARELVAVPYDATIARADEHGVAPIDLDPGAAGVQALADLARLLVSGSR